MLDDRAVYRPLPRHMFITQEGLPFILGALLAAGLAWLAGSGVFAAVLAFLAAFFTFFFRNPLRVPPSDAGVIVSPADGRVISVESGVTAPHLEGVFKKVSIFMSILNVHVNRFPVDAGVERVIYTKGRFLIADRDEASRSNEQNALVLKDESGRHFEVVQIAGFIARRIICYVWDGAAVKRGERMGLIRFGSRVDIYMPMEAEFKVKIGGKVKAGHTIIGVLQ